MAEIEKVTELLNSSLFRNITDVQAKKMLSCAGAKEKVYKSGAYVFCQGEAPRSLFLILDGSVMIAKDYASGRRNILFTAEKGDVFGEAFLFSDEKEYWYDAIAVDELTTMEIPWKFFYGFCNNACQHHQMVVRNMLEIQSGKNFMMTKKLYLLAGKTLRERLALWMVDNAGEDDSFDVELKREELADYLGTTRPSLSRELMNMQDEGLIKACKRTIRILDKERLGEYA